ncbi:MAG: hypothetical protein L0Y50_04395 [Beijerinckiaceae bacterium]|nr:hypothetical protein [Acidobacteriota bacterium]MCI0735497.1 hypothetical protein [Beijerinckiaceae bacterium]
MKLRSRFFPFALLGCCVGFSLSSAAQAASFQQYLTGTCAGQVCNINFMVVPAGKTLNVTNFSCYLRVSSTADIYALQLLVAGPAGGIQNAVTASLQRVDFVGPAPGQDVFQSNDTIFAFATAGQRFRANAQIRNGTFSQFACHISGQLLP